MITSSSSGHIGYIDALKGFGMLLVVMGHVVAWSFESYGSGFNVPAAKIYPTVLLWWNVIYAFHMPLLFWVSGLLFLSSKRPFSFRMLPNYLWRKTRTLLIPFLASGMVFALITGESFTKYWFLRTLFLFILLSLPYELFRQRVLSEHKAMAVLADLVCYLVLIYVVHVLSWKHRGDLVDILWDSEHIQHYKFFVFGIFCKRYDFLKKCIDSNDCYTLALIIFVVAMCLLHIPYSMFPEANLLQNVVPYAGILCSYYLFKIRLTDGRINNVFCYIGRHSLEIYILHFYFVFSIPMVGAFVIHCMSQDVFHRAMGSTLQLLYGVVCASVVCVFAIVAMKVVRASDLLSVLFLGRSNKKQVD